MTFTPQESELLLRLEMVACDGSCSNIRASELALVLLCTYLDTAVNRLDANADTKTTPGVDCSSQQAQQMLRLVQFAAVLQKMCNVRLIFNFTFYFPLHNTNLKLNLITVFG